MLGCSDSIRVLAVLMLAFAGTSCGQRPCADWTSHPFRSGYAGGRLCNEWGVGDPYETPEYGLEHYERGDCALVRFVLRRQGAEQLRTLDEVTIPLSGDSTWIAGIFCACEIDGSYDPELFALMRGVSTSPLRVWRANRRSWRIEEIGAAQVSCRCKFLETEQRRSGR